MFLISPVSSSSKTVNRKTFWKSLILRRLNGIICCKDSLISSSFPQKGHYWRELNQNRRYWLDRTKIPEEKNHTNYFVFWFWGNYWLSGLLNSHLGDKFTQDKLNNLQETKCEQLVDSLFKCGCGGDQSGEEKLTHAVKSLRRTKENGASWTTQVTNCNLFWTNLTICSCYVPTLNWIICSCYILTLNLFISSCYVPIFADVTCQHANTQPPRDCLRRASWRTWTCTWNMHMVNTSCCLGTHVSIHINWKWR